MTCGCWPANDRCPSECACSCDTVDPFGGSGSSACTRTKASAGAAGHPGYLALLEELRALHKTKSGGYGTSGDPFENFSRVAAMAGQPRYVYPVHRAIEKLTRVLSLHEQGRVAELSEEFLDVASLLVCAEAMRAEDV